MAENKIEPEHLKRRACIYIRQSSMAQVEHHQESTRRQYDFKGRAARLGWAPDQIEVIDDDQGRSAARPNERDGFQRLVAEVALGRIGAVLGLEMSRFARSCGDGYRLLEVAAISKTLIVDEDGVYDPNHYNDRLLLGLKVTLSEAELHLLKQRMVRGRRNKAQRGALRIRLPAGYVWDEEDGVKLDPDERVQAAVRLLFSVFERTGSAARAARYFEDRQLSFPRRDGYGSMAVPVNWGVLNVSRVCEVLNSPVYAGYYAYDRGCPHEVDLADLCGGGRVLIPEAHPGYISREQYERNKTRLAENRHTCGWTRQRGSPR
jgi:DNA invertase Pin-like site-specific DNA recombinase